MTNIFATLLLMFGGVMAWRGLRKLLIDRREPLRWTGLLVTGAAALAQGIYLAKDGSTRWVPVLLTVLLAAGILMSFQAARTQAPR